MLTGNLAFSGESLGDLLLQICAQPLPSLVNAAPWLPPAMETWFQIACAREPHHRYPSAQAFIEGLRAAASSPQATTSPVHTGGASPTGAGGPSLGVPSTTGASSLAIQSPPGPRPPWAVLALVVALAGCIAAAAVVVVMHGRKSATSETPPLASHTLPGLADAGVTPAATLEPIRATTPGGDSAAADAEASATNPADGGRVVLPPWHNGSGPSPTLTSTATTVKPPPGASTKPSGTIDLGY
jgi:hypothetical protein